MSEKIHQSRQETEQRSYDRARRSGINPDAARNLARESSEITHRKVDDAQRPSKK